MLSSSGKIKSFDHVHNTEDEAIFFHNRFERKIRIFRRKTTSGLARYIPRLEPKYAGLPLPPDHPSLKYPALSSAAIKATSIITRNGGGFSAAKLFIICFVSRGPTSAGFIRTNIENLRDIIVVRLRLREKYVLRRAFRPRPGRSVIVDPFLPQSVIGRP